MKEQLATLNGIAAIICFAIAVLAAVNAITANTGAWEAGGLLALTLALILPRA